MYLKLYKNKYQKIVESDFQAVSQGVSKVTLSRGGANVAYFFINRETKSYPIVYFNKGTEEEERYEFNQKTYIENKFCLVNTELDNQTIPAGIRYYFMFENENKAHLDISFSDSFAYSSSLGLSVEWAV